MSCRKFSYCSTSHKKLIRIFSSCASGQEIQAPVSISANAATRQIDCPGAAESHAPVNFICSGFFFCPSSPFPLENPTSPHQGYRSLRMTLRVRCSRSALLQTRWEKLQPIADEPKVIHSWLKADSTTKCALCQLVENEIRAAGQFEEEISALMSVSWPLSCSTGSSTD